VQYSSQQALVDDIELMFKNARHYNEENSQVYKDADRLEHLLHSRVRTLAPIDDVSKNLHRRLIPYVIIMRLMKVALCTPVMMSVQLLVCDCDHTLGLASHLPSFLPLLGT